MTKNSNSTPGSFGYLQNPSNFMSNSKGVSQSTQMSKPMQPNGTPYTPAPMYEPIPVRSPKVTVNTK